MTIRYLHAVDGWSVARPDGFRIFGELKMAKNYTAKTATKALRNAGMGAGEINSTLDRAESELQKAIDRRMDGDNTGSASVDAEYLGRAAYAAHVNRCIANRIVN